MATAPSTHASPAAQAPSYWLATADGPGLDSTARPPASADVAVVGGGVVGCACALWLGRLGARVALLESRRVGHGASGRNGGFLLGTPEQVERLRELLREERIDAELREPGHLALASSDRILEQFAAEIESRGPRAARVELLAPSDCEDLLGLHVSPRFRGGRWQRSGATIHPARLVSGLATAAARRGAVVVEGCAARSIERGAGGGLAVVTDRGTVHAGHVVVACAAGTARLVPGMSGLLRPSRGQVLATRPLPPRFRVGMAVDFGSLYWRQTSDGTIVLGGCRDADPEAESSAAETVNPVVQGALERFLPEAFPGLGRLPVASRWAGIMDVSPDGRPLVGPWPDAGRVWIAAGFAGHGLPLASGVGRTLAEAIVLGRESDWLERLAPDRWIEASAA